jgi:hypothetical protein
MNMDIYMKAELEALERRFGRVVFTEQTSDLYTAQRNDVGKTIVATADVIVPNDFAETFSPGDTITILNKADQDVFVAGSTNITSKSITVWIDSLLVTQGPLEYQGIPYPSASFSNDFVLAAHNSVTFQYMLDETSYQYYWIVISQTYVDLEARVSKLSDIPAFPISGTFNAARMVRGLSIDRSSGNVNLVADSFLNLFGATFMVTNLAADSMSITAGPGVTLRLAGSTATGTRTISGYGIATLRMPQNNLWFISGAGVT